LARPKQWKNDITFGNSNVRSLCRVGAIRSEDNIKMKLREIGIDGANWIRLDQDRVQWRAFVNRVMNLRVP
jgi:hypothetical protein